MRKPLLYSNPKYFKLLNKYKNLYARLKNMLRDGSYFSLEERIKKSLFRKFKLLYQRISKMQMATGIKTAGIAMAFTLISTIVDAQMSKKWIENDEGTALFNSGINHGSKSIAKFVDIDNDGDDDLFLGGYELSYAEKASAGKYTYKFFENKGQGAEELFVDADNDLDPILPISNTSNNPPFIDFMDNDGDGDLDVFAVNPNMCGSIDYYKNIGTQSSPKFELTSGSENPFDELYGAFAIAFEDIDQDEDLDLIINNNNCGIVRYFENEEGSFNEKTGIENPFTDLSLYNTALDFKDMDGDGDIDAIAGDNCYGIRYLENDPVSGELHFLVNYSDNPIEDVNGYNFYPSFADLDEDDDMDLIVSNYSKNYLYPLYHENEANAYSFLGIAPMIDLPISFEENENPKFFDLDGDGDLDMYVDDKGSRQNDRIYENIGNNLEPDLKLSSLEKFGIPESSYYETEAFVDIDNDGDLDMFAVPYGYSYKSDPSFKKVNNSKSPSPPIVKHYKNIGTSVAPEYELQDLSNNPLSAVNGNGYTNALAFTDLDGDGDLDAVLGAAYDNPTLTILKNTGTKEVAIFEEVSYCANPFEGLTQDPLNIEFADLDDDGDQDLIFGTYNANLKGTGAFLLFNNISDETNINFEAIEGLENPLDTFNTAYSNFAFTKLFNEDEISFIIRETKQEVVPTKKMRSFDITRYYSYQDILAMADKTLELDENTIAESVVDNLESQYHGDGDITYSIDTDDETLPFDINGSGLIVKTGASIDYEALENPSYQFSIIASDGTNETSSTFTVNINNLNDNSPVLNDKNIDVDENTSGGEIIAALDATDEDELGEITYTIEAGGENIPFDIDAANLIVSSGATIDYETLEDPIITFNVIASDGTNEDTGLFTVTVKNLNDNSPVLNDKNIDVNENTSGGEIIAALDATDEDELGEITYTIEAGGETIPFDIDAANLIVSSGATIDYEALDDPIIAFNVIASDGTNDDAGLFTITVKNLNDNSPVLNDKNIDVDENTSGGEIIAALDATDVDELGEITYTIEAGGETIPFDIDAANLIVSSGATIDYEALDDPIITFNVIASDGTNDDTGLFTITVNNLNDNAPILEDQTISLDENPTANDLVATLNATDADDLDELTYTITDGNTDEAFELSSNTIIVKTASIVDYETLTDHKFILTVEVSDGELIDDAAITVNINDVDESTGIEDLLKNNLVFYPNPVKDELNLIIGSELQGEIYLQVINSIGNVVKTATYKNQNEFKLNVSNLNSGIYFIQVNVGENTITKRVIIK